LCSAAFNPHWLAGCKVHACGPSGAASFTTKPAREDWVQIADARVQAQGRSVSKARDGELPRNWWRDDLKAVAEWPVALILVILASPLLLLIAVAVRVTTGSPVIYRRRVIGRGGVEFDAFKFRTMVNGAERVLEQDERLRKAFTVNWKLFSDPRVTRTGRVLRKYSLDELPQLFNVLRGEMSLIGPRMISPPELGQYGSLADRLLAVRPGLTGLWQVSGRQRVSYQRRVELDMEYIERCSLRLDLSILLKTIPVVLKAHGAF
jgi:lipopolysaccharide/colanic/teichoic acid biosynthesis glycosyltransferase